MNAAYYYLAIAICSEVIATVSMKAIKGFSTPIPLLLVIVGYGVAFWMLTLVVRTVPVGVAYAVWDCTTCRGNQAQPRPRASHSAST